METDHSTLGEKCPGAESRSPGVEKAQTGAEHLTHGQVTTEAKRTPSRKKEAVERENKKLRQANRCLEEMKDAAESSLKQSQHSEKYAEQKYVDLKKEAEGLKQNNEKLVSQKESLEATQRSLNEEIEALKSKVSEQANQMRQLKGNSLLESQNDKIVLLEREQSQLSSSIEAKDNDIADLILQNERIEKQLYLKTQELKTAVEDREAAGRAHITEQKILKKQLENATSAHDADLNVKKELEQALNEATATQQANINKIKELEEALNEATAAHQEYINEKGELVKALKKATVTHQVNVNKKQELEQALSEASASCEANANEKQKLQKHISTAERVLEEEKVSHQCTSVANKRNLARIDALLRVQDENEARIRNHQQIVAGMQAQIEAADENLRQRCRLYENDTQQLREKLKGALEAEKKEAAARIKGNAETARIAALLQDSDRLRSKAENTLVGSNIRLTLLEEEKRSLKIQANEHKTERDDALKTIRLLEAEAKHWTSFHSKPRHEPSGDLCQHDDQTKEQTGKISIDKDLATRIIGSEEMEIVSDFYNILKRFSVEVVIHGRVLRRGFDGGPVLPTSELKSSIGTKEFEVFMDAYNCISHPAFEIAIGGRVIPRPTRIAAPNTLAVDNAEDRSKASDEHSMDPEDTSSRDCSSQPRQVTPPAATMASKMAEHSSSGKAVADAGGNPAVIHEPVKVVGQATKLSYSAPTRSATPNQVGLPRLNTDLAKEPASASLPTPINSAKGRSPMTAESGTSKKFGQNCSSPLISSNAACKRPLPVDPNNSILRAPKQPRQFDSGQQELAFRNPLPESLGRGPNVPVWSSQRAKRPRDSMSWPRQVGCWLP